MRGLRLRLTSLKYELALLFFAIIALSFAVSFFLVVPQLRSNLEGQRLGNLERVAAGSSQTLERAMRDGVPAGELDELVRATAEVANARVTLLGVQKSNPPTPAPQFYVISDSNVGPEVASNWNEAAVAARQGGRQVVTGLVSVGNERFAQAAQQLYYFGRPNWVALYSHDLAAIDQAVALVRRRILVASALAMLIALTGSFLLAGSLARRVRRLDVAAQQVAAGASVEPLPVDSADELGGLTRSFNDMQERLQRADRARREFIANASHELRTPIFSLGGFVELLQDEDLEPETREEFLTTMREQIGRLERLAGDLLDLSRLDAGSLELRLQDVDLSELVRTVAGEFSPAIGRHRADLDLRLPRSPVGALCDPDRVAQIVRILLNNALTHTPEGTGVTVSAARHDGRAELTVADSGPGLQNASPERLFERFYTANAARGSGLGLAIARELAERMRGHIDLSARPGETAFTLELPAAERIAGGPRREVAAHPQ